jgi:ubiquinone/menaquinone biosynthesis C-methylase UbiE
LRDSEPNGRTSHNDNITWQGYLKDVQYRTSSNLEARINLHRRFSTNAYSWQRWVFDRLPLVDSACILEVGCGPGGLWRENLDRLPGGTKVVLADLSLGMAGSARQVLSGRSEFHFTNLDVQALPFPNHTFDLVIANHMLYHVPDLPRAVGELARMLKPGGTLCAATNGERHMLELRQAIDKFKPGYLELSQQFHRYNLQSASQIIDGPFMDVEVRRYPNDLVVTEIEPLQAYILSMIGIYFDEDEGEPLARLLRYLDDCIREKGYFFIGIDAGVVLARPS